MNNFIKYLPVFGLVSCVFAPVSFAEHSTWVGNPLSAKGLVLVLHGLNLKPSKMKPLAEAVCNAETQMACLIVTLPGHEESGPSQMSSVGAEKLKSAVLLEVATIGTHARGRPVHLLGFSLGSLAGAWAIQNLKTTDSRVPFRSAVLLAPPIETKSFARAAVLIPGPASWMIPSKNHVEYRANSGTSLGAYRALYRLQDELRDGDQSALNIPTLVFFNPRDELVSASKLKKRVTESKWTHWSLEEVGPLETTLKPAYDHLFIDEPSMGKQQWEKMKSRMLAFFASQR